MLDRRGELAHVAGPGVLPEQAQRLDADPLDVVPRLGTEFLEEVIREERNIFFPASQRRKVDGEDVEPVK